MITPARRRDGGFTLIELLVVVAIIAVLIAILLPSMKNARQNARATVCLANQHQLLLCVQMYAHDWSDRIFPYDNDTGLKYETFWMTLLEKYHNEDDGIRVCPSTDVDVSRQWGYQPWSADVPQPNSGWGTVSVAWGRPEGTGGFLRDQVGSYAWNSWMHGGRTKMFGSTPAQDKADDRKHWKKLAAVSLSNEVPVFADGIWVDTWFQNNPSGSKSGPPPHLQGYNSAAGRVCIDRHRMAINIGFADGGARRVDLQDLWRQRWNTESVPMAPPWALPNE